MKALFLRVSELAPREVEDGEIRIPVFGDFSRKVNQGEEVWRFHVFGKGDKPRPVTVADAYLPYLKRWREYLGLHPALPKPGDIHPLLSSTYGLALGSRQVARIYEQAIMLTVKRMRDENLMDDAQVLEAIRSETHYLRHTGASQAIEAGADIRHISEELGHASAAFTEAVYVNADQAQKLHAGKNRRV